MSHNKVLDEEILLDNLGKIAFTLDKAYISKLSSNEYGVVSFEKYNAETIVDFESNIRALKIKKCVLNKNESLGDCFKNVLSLFADGDHTIALVINRKVCSTEMFFVVKNDSPGRNEDSKNNVELLNDSIMGNFPGTETEYVAVENEETKKIFTFEKAKSVAVLVNNPSEYSEDYISQGLDRLLNGIVPTNNEEEYSVVFLAESLTQENLHEIVSAYEEMATAIYPFLSYQFQLGDNKTETEGEMSSIAKTKSISNSVFKSHSINLGVNGGYNRNSSEGKSRSYAKVAKSLLSIAGGAIGSIAGPAGEVIGSAIGKKIGSLAATKNSTNGKGWNVGGSLGYGYSWGKSKTISEGETITDGTNSSISIGSSESTSYTYKSYLVSNMIDKIEKTLERISKSQSTGIWKFSTYVFANREHTSKNVANYLRAVTQGKDSYVEPSFIQEWYKTTEDGSQFEEIKNYITHFTHPIFVTTSVENDEVGTMMVTPTSYVATDELSNVMTFPHKSLQGLPILECVSFGREPHSLIDVCNDIEIGCAYHMHKKYENQKINISKNELCKHTFITGTTGSGKSNTVFTLLDRVCQNDTKFLVVEPAKGEYKDVLGGKKDVTVYGTNPRLSRLLRINPFAFPKNILVSEHIDRLVEIFNVCWPMYAAMPAILKDAVIRAYESAGWNIITSENTIDENIFPTFKDVLDEIRLVLKESEYSSDNKGDYTGALVTRLKSLVNGISGLIFVADSINDEELFDENVIIDLSRVGSVETKSLIMGVLVMKLQEYRISNGVPKNDKLKHVTVLEEAHNLLKRTSVEQSNESSNLVGKSVEMLANSIAELRAFGEGFIIADQSPGLLDMSVIRNTNTKIIHRLPDFSDRVLVGKSATLDDEQIEELAKLSLGVAAIYQNDWIEPVLCKIEEFTDKSKCEHICDETKLGEQKKNLLNEIVDYILLPNENVMLDEERVLRSELSALTKTTMIKLINGDFSLQNKASIMYAIAMELPGFEKIKTIKTPEKVDEMLSFVLKDSICKYEDYMQTINALILKGQADRDYDMFHLYSTYVDRVEKMRKGLI